MGPPRSGVNPIRLQSRDLNLRVVPMLDASSGAFEQQEVRIFNLICAHFKLADSVAHLQAIVTI